MTAEFYSPSQMDIAGPIRFSRRKFTKRCRKRVNSAPKMQFILHSELATAS
jgi:hypothetical protein